MKPLTYLPTTLIVLFHLTACGATTGSSGPVLDEPWMPYAEGVALATFLNDGDIATFEVLDDVCAIRSDAADELVKYRNGPDGLYGTSDDKLFESADEIESVYRVGPVTMQALLTCATDFGYVPGESDLVLLDFLNDRRDTDVDRLDEDCGIRADVAGAILGHRNGKDGLVGTGDDNLFATVDELDGIAGVSDDTIADLRSCAAWFADIAPGGGVVR